MSRDYVPHSPVQFQVFMQRLLDYADAHINVDPPAWSNIPAGESKFPVEGEDFMIEGVVF